MVNAKMIRSSRRETGAVSAGWVVTGKEADGVLDGRTAAASVWVGKRVGSKAMVGDGFDVEVKPLQPARTSKLVRKRACVIKVRAMLPGRKENGMNGSRSNNYGGTLRLKKRRCNYCTARELEIKTRQIVVELAGHYRFEMLQLSDTGTDCTASKEVWSKYARQVSVSGFA
jgi:hypothetical protein